MMRGSTVLWVALAGVVGIGLFGLKYEVQALEDRLASINRQIRSDQETIHVLKAEWSFLNDPNRLRELAERHLAMRPVLPNQLSHVGALPVVEPQQPPFAQPAPTAPEAVKPPVAAPAPRALAVAAPAAPPPAAPKPTPAKVAAAPRFELPADFFAAQMDTPKAVAKASAPAPAAPLPYYAPSPPPPVTPAVAPARTAGGVTVIKSPALLAAERAGRIAQ